MVAKTKPLSVQSFTLGMNNRRADFKLRTEDGYFLREALNADVTEEGSIKRRSGYVRVLELNDAHSLWSDGESRYFADGGSLYALSEDLLPTFVTSIRPQSFVSYCTAPEGGAFWTDGATLQHLSGASTRPINPPVPALLPSVSVGAGGALVEGRYLVCFTQLDAAGRESPASHPEQFVVPAGGMLEVTLADDLPAEIDALRVYISGDGGQTTYRAYEFIAPATFSYGDSKPTGVACPTIGLASMPAGQIVRYTDGRLLVAAGSILYYSEPFAPGLYDPVSDYIPFPAEITIVEVVTNGFYVVADKTYWFGGAITATAMTEVLPYGAVPRTGEVRRDQTLCHWMTPRGLIEAGPGGALKNLQEANVTVGAAGGGATLVRESNGIKQAVSSLYGDQTHQRATASSYFDAEIINGATA